MVSVVLAILASLMGTEPGEFTIVIPVRPESQEGQRLITSRAAQLCGGLYPQLLRYRFSGDEALAPAGGRSSRFEVVQQFACLDAPPPPAAGAPVPSDWQPTAEDERQVRTLTEQYFLAVDVGDASRVHQFWSASQREETSLETRASELADFRRQAGAPGTHRIAKMTWYVNPQGAPRPGVYVAVDYERDYARFALNCGYLIWFMEGAGHFVLTREETSVLARDDVGPSPNAPSELRTIMQCEGR